MRYFDFMESELPIDNLNPLPGQIKFLNDLDTTVRLIRKNCSHYLRTMMDNRSFIYRGIRNSNESSSNFIIGNSFVDRYPKDSTVESQKLWDSILDKLNIKAKRSNSIFATGDKNQAWGYGKMYLIFPYNDVAFSWSRTKKDVIVPYKKLASYMSMNIDQNKMKQLVQIVESLKTMTNSITIAESLHFNRLLKNILGFIHLPNEALVSSIKLDLKIIRIKIKNPTILGILDELEQLLLDINKNLVIINVEEFQSHYEIKDTDFAEAVNSGHEICISGRYIGVHYQYESEIIEHNKYYDEHETTD